MARSFWRRHRSSENPGLRYKSTRTLATSLGNHREIDAATQLLASTFVGNNKDMLLDLKLRRVGLLKKNGQNKEALKLLQTMVPEATTKPHIYSQILQHLADTFFCLRRYPKAYDMFIDLVALTKETFGQEDPKTLTAMRGYAATLY